MNRNLGISAAVIFALMTAVIGANPLHAATSSIVCGSHTVTVSTGGTGGSCVKSGTVITCNDNGTGTSVGGGCDAGGAASCGNSVGAGTCTIALKRATATGKIAPRATTARPNTERN